MMNLAEYRRTATRLADYLPWAALVGSGVVLNKDGSFQRTAKFRGPDLDSAVAAELVAVAGRINNAVRRLGSGWSIFVEAQRSEAATYPDSTFPDPASALVDAERKAGFEEAGAHFVSGYFLTFLYLPPAEEAARAETWLYEGREKTGVDPWELLRGFIDRTDRVLALLDGFMPECRWLDDGETLTYLHSTISTNRHRVRVPEVPMHLDALLADQPLDRRAGAAPWRRASARPDHRGIPDRDDARPARRDEPAAVPLSVEHARDPARQDRRHAAADQHPPAMVRQAQVHRRDSERGDDQRGNPRSWTPTPPTRRSTPTWRLQELGADVAGMAYVTATVTVWDADPRIADEKLRLVEKIVQGRDFTAMAETVNAVDAWLGCLPGHAYANVRQPPISTFNLAHMIPLSAVWAGPERDEHFGAPPLLLRQDRRLNPVPVFSPCRRRRPHPRRRPDRRGQVACCSRSWRSSSAATPRSQVFAFDFGG